MSACHEVQLENAMRTCFVGVCPEEENMKKKMIDKKIKIETKRPSSSCTSPTVFHHKMTSCAMSC